MTNGNGSGVWKWIAVSASSVILGVAIHTMTQPDVVQEKELKLQLSLINQKIDTLDNRLTTVSKQLDTVQDTVNKQNVEIARLADKAR